VSTGRDLTSTPVGKSLKVGDLRADDTQKKTDAQLIEITTAGKEKMPAFKDKLTADQIKQLVTYVRELAKKKETKKALAQQIAPRGRQGERLGKLLNMPSPAVLLYSLLIISARQWSGAVIAVTENCDEYYRRFLATK